MTSEAVREALPAHASVRDRYNHMAKAGVVHADGDQQRIADQLDDLCARLAQKRLASKSSSLGWLFAKRKLDNAPVRGLYIYGGVGRGKTMLMDLFFQAVPVSRKRRAHFNDFMADVHDRIARHRAALKAGTAKGDDPIPPVAAAIAGESWLICFDEFAVTDIADAMILSRLFSALFAHGVTLVATSNVAPRDLYRDGLNRGLFLPFIDVLERHADVATLDHDTDYRLKKLDRLKVYVTPLGPAAESAMNQDWEMLCDGAPEVPVTIELKGRKVVAERAAGAAARFTFAQLCEQPLGARDYIALAERFSTLMVENVPVMEQKDRNAAKRFILLIDTLYDRHTRLIVSAAAEPTGLYVGKSGAEAFEFDRTISRLIEMQSKDWVASVQLRAGTSIEGKTPESA